MTVSLSIRLARGKHIPWDSQSIHLVEKQVSILQVCKLRSGNDPEGTYWKRKAYETITGNTVEEERRTMSTPDDYLTIPYRTLYSNFTRSGSYNTVWL